MWVKLLNNMVASIIDEEIYELPLSSHDCLLVIMLCPGCCFMQAIGGNISNEQSHWHKKWYALHMKSLVCIEKICA
jgi:hypothetical protein